MRDGARPRQLDILWQRQWRQKGGGVAKLHASCKRYGVEPFAWFRDVLSRIPTYSITRLSELLPHNWQPATSPAQA
jgi:hypothetical protein